MNVKNSIDWTPIDPLLGLKKDTELGRQFGVSPVSIYSRRKKLGVMKYIPKIDCCHESWSYIQDAINEEGMTVKQFAHRYKIEYRTLFGCFTGKHFPSCLTVQDLCLALERFTLIPKEHWSNVILWGLKK